MNAFSWTFSIRTSSHADERIVKEQQEHFHSFSFKKKGFQCSWVRDLLDIQYDRTHLADFTFFGVFFFSFFSSSFEEALHHFNKRKDKGKRKEKKKNQHNKGKGIRGRKKKKKDDSIIC